LQLSSFLRATKYYIEAGIHNLSKTKTALDNSSSQFGLYYKNYFYVQKYLQFRGALLR